MGNNLWKCASVVIVLSVLVAGLAMLLAGCGPGEGEEVMPTPVPVKPAATPVLSQVEGEAEVPVPPPVGTKAGVLIDDFEGGDFDGRWWSYADEGTVSFLCTTDQPGHASVQAMRLTFEVGIGGYVNCGIDTHSDRWEDAEGLSFSWRADRSGLTMIVVLDMEDPTQTNPEAEGITPFQAELQTPGEEWTPVMLTWDAFTKAEWVGEGGVDELDPTHVVGLYLEVVGEQSGSIWVDDLQLMAGLDVAAPVSTASPIEAPVPSKTEEPVPPPATALDKWALWTDGPHLRGANIYQRRVYPELDGPEFMGPGPVGPPFTQKDFDRLAALGANYVNISHPGLFTENPPYTADPDIQNNLDNLLDMIAKADMFAVISFRTGPGRAEFSVCCLGDDWFDESYLNDSVWQDQAAQDDWAEMWRYTAERYGDNPHVVGYDLMVEPNSNEVWLDIWEPEEFHSNYGGTLYDWNQLYPRITAAIREMDPDTPILIGAMSYSAVAWLPYLQPTGDPRTVYVLHQYAPVQYTHQWQGSQEFTYPGVFDTDWDGEDDPFNRAWLEDLLSTVDDFVAKHGVPVAVNEFGLVRWVPGAAEFMDDEMDLFERRGINHALWAWDPSWGPWTEENDAFNFCHGPDPDHHADVASSDLIDVITKYWVRNSIRPSKPY
jgi:hypothetical protein